MGGINHSQMGVLLLLYPQYKIYIDVPVNSNNLQVYGYVMIRVPHDLTKKHQRWQKGAFRLLCQRTWGGNLEPFPIEVGDVPDQIDDVHCLKMSFLVFFWLSCQSLIWNDSLRPGSITCLALLVRLFRVVNKFRAKSISKTIMVICLIPCYSSTIGGRKSW